MYFSQTARRSEQPGSRARRGVRLSMSTDGGRTFAPVDQPVHDDKHAIWWDPTNSNHVLIGTDGGAYQTWDMTRTWIWFPNLPVATFYHVGFDLEYPFNVCGGMQDNYNWCGPSAVRTSQRHHERSLAHGAGRRRLRRRSSISATRASSTPSRRTAT